MTEAGGAWTTMKGERRTDWMGTRQIDQLEESWEVSRKGEWERGKKSSSPASRPDGPFPVLPHILEQRLERREKKFEEIHR